MNVLPLLVRHRVDKAKVMPLIACAPLSTPNRFCDVGLEVILSSSAGSCFAAAQRGGEDVPCELSL